MKSSLWNPKHTIKAREDLERILENKNIKIKEENSFKINLKQINSPSILSNFLAFFRKKNL